MHLRHTSLHKIIPSIQNILPLLAAPLYTPLKFAFVRRNFTVFRLTLILDQVELDFNTTTYFNQVRKIKNAL